jgi:hypothetical protein
VCVLFGGGELTHCTTEGQPPDGSYAVAKRLVGNRRKGPKRVPAAKLSRGGIYGVG